MISTLADPAPPVVEREYTPSVPQLGAWGDDPPVVGLRGALTPAVRGEQSVRPHDAQHPRAGDADPVQDPKPCVDLATVNGDRARQSSCASDLFQRRRRGPCSE